MHVFALKARIGSCVSLIFATLLNWHYRVGLDSLRPPGSSLLTPGAGPQLAASPLAPSPVLVADAAAASQPSESQASGGRSPGNVRGTPGRRPLETQRSLPSRGTSSGPKSKKLRSTQSSSSNLSQPHGGVTSPRPSPFLGPSPVTPGARPGSAAMSPVFMASPHLSVTTDFGMPLGPSAAATLSPVVSGVWLLAFSCGF